MYNLMSSPYENWNLILIMGRGLWRGLFWVGILGLGLDFFGWNISDKFFLSSRLFYACNYLKMGCRTYKLTLTFIAYLLILSPLSLSSELITRNTIEKNGVTSALVSITSCRNDKLLYFTSH